MSAVTYEKFIEAKVNFDETYGFDVADVDLHPILKPHQRDIVRWAVKGGRRAIFAAFGMGKSVMQLETLRLILDRDGRDGRALIVCPLGVRIEFAHDAEMLGMSGYDSPLYAELFDGWHRKDIAAPTTLSGDTDRTEVLWSNRPIGTPDLFSFDAEVGA